MRKNQRLAFTLIELLVVISIIGILALLGFTSYTAAQKQTRDAQRKSDLSKYQAALETYSAKHNSLYPLYSGDVTQICDELEIDSCPTDPDPDKLRSYIYNSSDGSAYTLSSELESKEATWQVDSEGTAKEIFDYSTATPLTTSTPITTTTPVVTITPASLPTMTTTPTTTSTPVSCPGCYQDKVCLPGTLSTACGIGGQKCVDCTIFGSDYMCFYGDCVKKSVEPGLPDPK